MLVIYKGPRMFTRHKMNEILTNGGITEENIDVVEQIYLVGELPKRRRKREVKAEVQQSPILDSDSPEDLSRKSETNAQMEVGEVGEVEGIVFSKEDQYQHSICSPYEMKSSNVNPLLSGKKEFRRSSVVRNFEDTYMGSQGHYCLVGLEEFVDGTHYMECSMNSTQSIYNPFAKPKQPPSFRIGITTKGQHIFAPLGGDNSYCFKSTDGSCVHNKQILSLPTKKLSVQPGDTVGVLFHIGILCRDREVMDSSLNPGSYLALFLNGEQVHRVKDLKKGAYTMGVSLFNRCSVTLNIGPNYKHPSAQKLQKSSRMVGERLIRDQEESDIESK